MEECSVSVCSNGTLSAVCPRVCLHVVSTGKVFAVFLLRADVALVFHSKFEVPAGLLSCVVMINKAGSLKIHIKRLELFLRETANMTRPALWSVNQQPAVQPVRAVLSHARWPYLIQPGQKCGTGSKGDACCS